MLDNLVESKNNAEAARKLSGFLLSTFLIISMILSGATVWSLFAKDFSMGENGMELSKLVAPIPVADDAPRPSEPEKPKPQTAPKAAESEVPSRKSNMARVDETHVAPDKVSTAPNQFKARPNSPFVVNETAVETEGCASCGKSRGTGQNGEIGFKKPGDQALAVKPDIPKPPPALKKPEENKKPPADISLGVINGKATSLPKPPYPPSARAVGASGAVNVQVTIDENGKVISARAVSGHVLLRDAAERAARSARFTPTYLSERAVKVNGLIVYNFTR